MYCFPVFHQVGFYAQDNSSEARHTTSAHAENVADTGTRHAEGMMHHSSGCHYSTWWEWHLQNILLISNALYCSSSQMAHKVCLVSFLCTDHGVVALYKCSSELVPSLGLCSVQSPINVFASLPCCCSVSLAYFSNSSIFFRLRSASSTWNF